MHCRRSVLVMLLITTFSISGLALAQRPPSIHGAVVDGESGMPLSNANILVYAAGGEEKITGTASDDEGRFQVTGLDSGRYDLKISVIGFKPEVIRDIVVDGGSEGTALGRIKLSPLAVELEEVAMTVPRVEMLLTADRKVYRVSENAVTSGGSASEVLETIPSVTVDIEGNVSLRGNENVRILIDGKPSASIGMDAAEALQQLPADMIESIEVMTNPSAKYDAEGVAGIINIVLKKQRERGANGSVNVFGGYPQRYGGSFNINYRVGKFNLFINDGLRYYSYEGGGWLDRDYFTANPWSRLEEDTDFRRGGWRNDIRTGFEFIPDPRNTLTFSVFNEYSESESNAEVTYHYFDANGDLASHIIRTTPEDETERWNGLNFGYRHDFNGDQQGNNGNGERHRFTFDYKLETGGEDELSDIEEDWRVGLTPGTEVPKEEVINREAETSHLFQADYTYPFSKEGKIEAGAKSEIQDQEYEWMITEVFTDGTRNRLTDVSNHVGYLRNVHAAYLTYSNRLGKLLFQLGLRGEYTHIETSVYATGAETSRDYADLFPSVHLTYELGSVNSLLASYSRRLRRPRFWHLIPFHNYVDSRNIRRGNPDLDPEYSQIYELGHLMHWETGSINTNIYYRSTTNGFERIETVTDTVVITQPYNLGSREGYGLEWIISKDYKRFFNFQGSLNIIHESNEGSFAGKDYSLEYTTWFARATTRVMIGRLNSAQASFRYRGAREGFQGTRKGMPSLDLGFSRSLFDRNGTLTLSVRNALASHKRVIETTTDVYTSTSEFRWHGQTVTLQFTYRFNQDRKRQRDRVNGQGETVDFDDDVILD